MILALRLWGLMVQGALLTGRVRSGAERGAQQFGGFCFGWLWWRWLGDSREIPGKIDVAEGERFLVAAACGGGDVEG